MLLVQFSSVVWWPRSASTSSKSMAEGTNSGTEVPVSDAVVGTEVRVSGADTGVVGPVRAAVTTASTLSEADIAIIVHRVTRNLQPPAASGTSMCPASLEGERDTVVDSLCYCACVGRAAVQSSASVSHVWFVWFSEDG